MVVKCRVILVNEKCLLPISAAETFVISAYSVFLPVFLCNDHVYPMSTFCTGRFL